MCAAHILTPAANGNKGIKAPGTNIPGHLVAGSFRKDGEWTFFDVHNSEKILVIDLENEHYKRLVVEVEDPVSSADIINNAAVQ